MTKRVWESTATCWLMTKMGWESTLTHDKKGLGIIRHLLTHDKKGVGINADSWQKGGENQRWLTTKKDHYDGPLIHIVCLQERRWTTNTLCWCCWSLCWLLLYSAMLRSRADSLRSHVILQEWLVFYSAFLNIHRSGVLTALTWLVPHETAAILARSVYTIQPCTMSHHAKPHT